jgi:hypothetical protein
MVGHQADAAEQAARRATGRTEDSGLVAPWGSESQHPEDAFENTPASLDS